MQLEQLGIPLLFCGCQGLACCQSRREIEITLQPLYPCIPGGFLLLNTQRFVPPKPNVSWACHIDSSSGCEEADLDNGKTLLIDGCENLEVAVCL
jgi:hypothetical protein